jgi:hypothetical protein
VRTKKDSSGSKGDRSGSAVVPKETRIEGVMMRMVIITITMSIRNIEPPGGAGGGGVGPLAINHLRRGKGMKVSLEFPRISLS